MIGAMCKIHCTEMLFDCVYKCMQVVGVNSMDTQHQFGRYLREASLLPLYDAGNFGMQRRRVHGAMTDPSFNPRAVMDDEPMEFTKSMEGIDTIPGPTADVRDGLRLIPISLFYQPRAGASLARTGRRSSDRRGPWLEHHDCGLRRSQRRIRVQVLVDRLPPGPQA